MTQPRTNDAANLIRTNLGERNLVLVGLMGAGKTTIGRRLAKQLGLSFIDADTEIETAAGQTVEEIFTTYGEQHFRDGERKVITRILAQPSQVVATGGGAFMNADIRKAIAQASVSIWLKADRALLLKRVEKRSTRPLLKAGDPKEIMRELITTRYPVYELADFVIQSRDVPHDIIVDDILAALKQLAPV